MASQFLVIARSEVQILGWTRIGNTTKLYRVFECWSMRVVIDEAHAMLGCAPLSVTRMESQEELDARVAFEGPAERPFKQNYAMPPGVTIRDCMTGLGLDCKDLHDVEAIGDLLQLYPTEIQALFGGLLRIDWPLAERLSNVFGGPDYVWMMREAQYRGDLARLAAERDDGP